LQLVGKDWEEKRCSSIRRERHGDPRDAAEKHAARIPHHGKRRLTSTGGGRQNEKKIGLKVLSVLH